MSVAVQTVIVAVIVLIAAYFVLKSLAREIRGFRGARRSRAKRNASSASQPPQLIQIQTRPPIHMRRPPSDDT